MIGQALSRAEDIRRYDFQSVIAAAAGRFGDAPFLRFENASYSFRDADRISNALGNGLLAIGVKQGDHVALLLDNCPELVWYYLALGKIGAVFVPLNTAVKGELLARYLRQSNACCLVVDDALRGRAAEVVSKCPDLRQAVIVGAQGGRPGALGSLPCIDHAQVAGGAESAVSVEIRFTDTAYLSFTSGTSGPSKANIATQAHTFAMAAAVGRAFGYDERDVLYTCLPIYHGNAMRSLFVALLTGSTIALARKFSVSRFWQDVDQFGATQFNLLGAMADMLWQLPSVPQERGADARKCMIVPTPRFAIGFAARFNLEMCSTFALTDFGYLTFLTPADPPAKWGSAGRPQPDIELSVLDDDDFELEQGCVGEICARPRQAWVCAQGYHEMPGATVAAWRNFWFHTGDRGFLDSDGYLYFVDRKKDSIRRRGENISAHEVEQIIAQHPEVADVAAYAMDCEMSEDEVMVSVVLRDGADLDEATLVHWCSAQMASFMVPRFVEFIPALPRTPTLKIEKYRLSEAAKANRATLWDREKVGIKIER